jgi:phosphonate transport system permease protein
MGFVGAGGLGQLMDQAMKMLNGGEASTILLTFLLLVLAADALSHFLRQQVGAAGTVGRQAGFGASACAIAGLVLLAVVTSFGALDIRFGALLTRESMGLIGDFAVSFFPPDLSLPWLSRVAYGTLETLAISATGTLLAVLGGLVLAFPASGRYGHLAGQFSRFLLNALRSIPELVWATLTVLSVGLGPFAGVLALALHTTGVLGRLFAETLQNAPPAARDALVDAGARPAVAFLYGTLPEVMPQLLAYTLYRWEMNIRMAAILGFVGAGGLGQLLYFELSLFRYAEACTVIAAMLLLSIAVDAASSGVRRRLR